MSTFKWIASITLATTILPVLHAEPHRPGNAASLRFRVVQRSLMIVPVEINHTGPYDFLVDTGAQVTGVDPALAAELHLKIEGMTMLIGVGFRARPSFAHLDTLEAGSHAIANPLVVVQNIEHLQAADPRIRGILGGNFLRHFDLLIDYANGLLYLDETKLMQPEVKGKHIALVMPPHSEGGGLVTERLIISIHLSRIPGRPLLQLLDSGANVPFLFDSGKDMVGGFSVSAQIRDRGPDGAERVFAVLPPQDMQIGTLTLHQLSFVTPTVTRKDLPKVEEVDGLLPTALFRRVYISYADRFVILEPW
ncbi:retropepsin-like aspartic protease [Edaphobacter bradus]|uniref:retropepsin-like aspartic protease n=1 Tax=Edaphobacter bradus TaxID=2259016 RepID=UPI0021DF9AC9|nr:retropepsin-like aspartic protease [Edaphobacter bradus]